MPTNLDAPDGVQHHDIAFANNLSEALRKAKYMLVDKFSCQPQITQYGTQASPVTVPTFPTAAQDNIDLLTFADAMGNRGIELYQTTAQTLMPSIHASKGLLVGCDVANNEAIELVPGGNRASNPLGYTAGTGPGVFLRATFEFADVSGTDQFIVGFRKQEAYVVPTSFLSAGDALYTDFIGIGFSGAADPNDVKIMSDLNNGGSTTVTDTLFNWADGLSHKLEIRIRKRVAEFYINGVKLGDTVRKDAAGASITAQPTASYSAFTVDSGDFMIPFIFHRYDATTPGAVYISRIECGQLLEVGLDPANR